MTICPKHPDSEPCGRKVALDAVELITAAKSTEEAAQIAGEAMRQILVLNGGTSRAKSFSGLSKIAEAAKP